MSDNEQSIFYTQWGVVQKINGDDPQLMPQLSLDRDSAEGYRTWLIERDQEIKVKAEREKEIMDSGSIADLPEGNQNFHHWFTGITYGRRPIKDASYHLATRRVSDWSEIDE